MTIHGTICTTPTYHYNGWDFEYGQCGPWPLKNDGELRKKCGRKFLDDLDGFFKLSDDDKKQFRVGGGCIYF